MKQGPILPLFLLRCIAICSSFFLLTRSKDKIEWECNNGGQLWTDSVDSGYATSASFPSGFCTAGLSSLNIVFIVSLLIDLGFQVSTAVPCVPFADLVLY